MTAILYIDGNDNDIIISPVRLRRENVIETDIVFSCTLKDEDGNPISGATALETSYETDTQCNVVVIPGSATVSLEPGRYTLDAAGTGAYANKVKVTDKPVMAQYRRG